MNQFTPSAYIFAITKNVPIHSILRKHCTLWKKQKQKQKQNRNSWKRRKLSLVGKVDNIKTPSLSKLIYHSSLLTVPKPLVLNRVNKIKPPKMISGEKYRDGLKMIESKIMERSLKIA